MRRLIALLLAFLLVSARVATAQPANQLAIGARAAALGASFVALADDGYAAYWNPAGLPSLRHQEINTMRADLFGTGFIASYLSYAVPFTDRFGAAVDWVNQGFDDEELRYGQDRVGFAAGYRLADWLALGGSAKWYRFDSALEGLGNPSGFRSEGSGWGFDLGLIARIRPGFKIGAVAQDVGDTQIEYENGVSRPIHPMHLRLGAAYRVMSRLQLNIGLDEAARFGAEYRLHPALSLRGGLQRNLEDAIGTTLTFGAGVRHRFLQIDYAYTQLPDLKPTHRFSLGLAFNLSGSAIRIQEVQVQPVFPAFHARYDGIQPIGRVKLMNRDDRPHEAVLSFYIPELMSAPSRKNVSILPKETKEVDIDALKFSARINEVTQPQNIQAEVKVEYTVNQRARTHEQRSSLWVYGRNNTQWDDLRKAAAFITSEDPLVGEFARPLLGAFEDEIKSSGRTGRNILGAMVLFEALRQHGVHYVADANNPYARMAADKAAVDNIQYPAELLQHRAGDCDDLTALYCALLESAGIATALVDYPEHIFMMFDTGIPRYAANSFPLAPSLYITRGEKLWIPVEITKISSSFYEAWMLGLAEIEELPKRRRRSLVVDTAKAWEAYLPSGPRFAGAVPPPPRAAFEQEVAAQIERLEDVVEDYVESTYIVPLKADPANDRLREDLALVYSHAGQLDKLLALCQQWLEEGVDKVLVYFIMGNTFFKTEYEEAVRYYRLATEIEPHDKRVERNIDLLMTYWGKAKSLGAVTQGATAETEAIKRGEMEVDLDKLYGYE